MHRFRSATRLPGRPAPYCCPRTARTPVRLALACVALGFAALTTPARADISIEIDGVDAELRRNVLAFLSLERYKGRDDLDEALLERLQERAIREAASALRPFGYYEPKVESRDHAAGSKTGAPRSASARARR